MSEIITKIDETVRKHNMLSDGDTVVVGVSGGADSMLLLHYLQSAAKYNIIVANVEHGIRGAESKADSEFVRNYCVNHGIRFEMLEINAPEEAKAQGLGVEEYSRNRRYEFFDSFNADKIAVAHNLSDSVETMLFRIARGTSIKGLSGIPAVRDNIIRPLIDCTSDEIRAACCELGIDYVIDETNRDNTYSRNYIRNVIVPEFKRLNPSFEGAAKRLLISASEDDAFIEECAVRFIAEASFDGGVSLSRLKEQNIAVQKRVISLLAAEYGIVPDALHLTQALELLCTSKRLQLKDDIYIASSGDLLRVFKLTDNECKKAVLKFDIIERSDIDLSSKTYTYCDFDKLAGAPRFKEREAGDSISPEGRNCTKSLKKLYNELNIPAEKRDKLHIIADDGGIVAVFGYAVDERVKVDSNTKHIALFNITTED